VDFAPTKPIKRWHLIAVGVGALCLIYPLSALIHAIVPHWRTILQDLGYIIAAVAAFYAAVFVVFAAIVLPHLLDSLKKKIGADKAHLRHPAAVAAIRENLSLIESLGNIGLNKAEFELLCSRDLLNAPALSSVTALALSAIGLPAHKAARIKKLYPPTPRLLKAG